MLDLTSQAAIALGMRQMQPVLWPKGVLLTPQHLQTQDRFLEDLLGFQVSNLAFKPYGFCQLQVDREALADRTLAISSAVGILPDGLQFDIPAADPPPEPKAIDDDLWREDENVLDLFLCLPAYRGDAKNVGLPGQGSDTRYLADVLVRRDETTGLAERPIQVARKNFKVLADTESRDGVVSLPLTRVLRTQSGDCTFDTSFVPPVINIAASDRLLTIARRLVERLVARAGELAADRSHKDPQRAHFGSADVEEFWLLYTVNTHLPLIRHIFEVRQGHPAELYASMLSLAGALSTFARPPLHPKDFPQYQHDSPSSSFGELDELILELLTIGPLKRLRELPMQEIEPLIHGTGIEEDRWFDAPHWYLTVRSTASPADLSSKVPRLVKISSRDRVRTLISQAMSGVELTYLPTPPPSVKVKTDRSYFELSKKGDAWDQIRQARDLAAYVPADIPDADLSLLVLLPQKE